MEHIKNAIRRMMGRDPHQEDREREVVSEAIKESREARMQAYDAIAQAGWRKPGRLETEDE